MRKLNILMLLVLFVNACKQDDKATVNRTIKNIGNGEIL